ncbi:amphi-Trp domain-containing protein [Halobacteriales archaeon Cl-PHB]
MPEEVLFEREQTRDRAEVAAFLRDVADRLEDGETVTLASGDDSIDLDLPRRVEFEVAVEREGPAGGPGELELEFELEWDEDASHDDGTLSVE